MLKKIVNLFEITDVSCEKVLKLHIKIHVDKGTSRKIKHLREILKQTGKKDGKTTRNNQL